jgi:hypothetical protein
MLMTKVGQISSRGLPSGPRPPCRADAIGGLGLGLDGSHPDAVRKLAALGSVGMGRRELGIGGVPRGLGGQVIMAVCGHNAQPISRKVVAGLFHATAVEDSCN